MRFNSAELVRRLTELAVADVSDPKQTFAERLGEWLDFKDALALYSALNSTVDSTPGRGASVAVLRAEWLRVRASLASAIAAPGAAQPEGANLALPTPLADASVESAADFTPFHRYYLAHQRAMTAAIGPLRAGVRSALMRHSAALKQLAALDAVMEQTLSAREAGLLATVPALLGKRFERLFAAHQGARAHAESDGAASPPGRDDDPAEWMRPGGWLAQFCAEMQRVLLAELELRLMPVAGLLAAVDQESTGRE